MVCYLKHRIKNLIGILLAATAVAINYSAPVITYTNIPNEIVIENDSDWNIDFGLPVKYTIVSQNKEDDFSIKADTNDMILGSTIKADINSNGNSKSILSYSVFGLFPKKTIDIISVDAYQVILGGQSIGITMKCEGVLIVGFSEIITEDMRTVLPAKDAGIKTADFITKVNDKDINSAAELSKIIGQSGGDVLDVEIRRDNHTLHLEITPAKDKQDGKYHIGVWGRDSSSGIGTLTFIEPYSKSFGALGHSISDLDTNSILPIKEGKIYRSRIVEIRKGMSGEPGELEGEFILGVNEIGSLQTNSPFGLYGQLYNLNNIDKENMVECAQISEIHKGKAMLYTTIDSEGVKGYECEVTKVDYDSVSSNKNMIIRITDEELLEKTGGIVQGMSGSPIIQNGKLIGAVTHVFVNDPTTGHAVFITSMVDIINE